MRRGGNWDNSDIKGASKLEWTDTDRLVRQEPISALSFRILTFIPLQALGIPSRLVKTGTFGSIKMEIGCFRSASQLWEIVCLKYGSLITTVIVLS